jgi:predicted nucleic acid-binding protein
VIIVADTTPIHYLSLIGEVEILKELFGRVIIPQAVFDELHRDRTPQLVKDWVDSQPAWLEVKLPSLELDDLVKSLGKGEREAIALAIELKADALLLDDKRAKSEARRRNVPVITTLNILEAAAERGWLDLPDTIVRLRQMNFYLPAEDVIMEDFYRRILAGQPRADALREAQLAMKAKYPDPFYWGAFICQGDPGPLLSRASI